jgi:hypothetical protein
MLGVGSGEGTKDSRKGKASLLLCAPVAQAPAPGDGKEHIHGSLIHQLRGERGPGGGGQHLHQSAGLLLHVEVFKEGFLLGIPAALQHKATQD